MLVNVFNEFYKLVSLKHIKKQMEQRRGKWIGNFKENELSTVFQPIYSLSHQRTVGYEALARVENPSGDISNPVSLFETLKTDKDLINLDRLCRGIHLKNFSQQGDDTNWIFLNVSPKVLTNGKNYGSYFSELLDFTSIPAHRVVIEVVEQSASDHSTLEETVEYYRDLGCLIAIDDFGAGQSNFERVWMLKPDIVKLDRSMIVHADEKESVRNLLPGIVSILHQAGALVLIEGIETVEQAMIAMASNADFVQGYFFSGPVTSIGFSNNPHQLIESLFKKHKSETYETMIKNRILIEQCQILFTTCVSMIQINFCLAQATKKLFESESIVRAYLLRPDGIQEGETIHSQKTDAINDERFVPIQSGDRADWGRRQYLQRAILHPNQIQISRPYLSITGAHMCITASMLFNSYEGERVLCADIVID